MASLELNGLDELLSAFERIADIPWPVADDALNGMAEVTAAKVKAEGETMGVRDPESDVHILDKIKPTKAKPTDSGGYQMITFSGSRTRNGKKTRNAEIAFVNEYGRRSQKARPFMGTAMEKNADAITAPAEKIIGDWIENEYMK